MKKDYGFEVELEAAKIAIATLEKKYLAMRFAELDTVSLSDNRRVTRAAYEAAEEIYLLMGEVSKEQMTELRRRWSVGVEAKFRAEKERQRAQAYAYFCSVY